MSRTHLPSTVGLRVVAALAQHGTVSSAADALHLTQSAVSKQLKNIEALAGTPLFDRTSQGLSPTDAGTIYIEQARIALGALETAAVRVAALRRSQPAIRLHVLPILGDRWFMPCFSRFTELHPEIEVEFTTFAASDTVEEADAVFRFGEGNWPGWRADYFLGRDVILVGAPQLIAREGGITSLEDIRRYPVLEHRQTPLRWSDFAQATHLNEFVPARITRFGYYSRRDWRPGPRPHPAQPHPRRTCKRSIDQPTRPRVCKSELLLADDAGEPAPQRRTCNFARMASSGSATIGAHEGRAAKGTAS